MHGDGGARLDLRALARVGGDGLALIHGVRGDVVALDEELDAEDAQAGAVAVLGEGVGDFLGHLPGGGERLFTHGHRLPGLDVVAVLLAVTDGHAE